MLAFASKCFFFKNFGGHESFFLGHWYSCIGRLVRSSLGFRARVSSLIYASPSSWPYVCVAVRPEISPHGKVEHIKFQFIINKCLKFGIFSWGACLKFTSQIKCDFISSPHAFKTYKTENMYSNVYFSILGLDFVVFQRNILDKNWNNCIKLCKIVFPY